ncbi:hypothetical protein DRN43_00960 [Thermococci archaeon]|nr:MAG: hypothetical protein DRN43_00960 [Thermococci archaeon]
MSWKRGAYPEFTLEDVVATLFILKEPKGRKQISEELGLGEGSVRTLLKKLSSLGLIESKQRGHYLSEKGKIEFEKIKKLFSEPKIVSKIENMSTYALAVHNPPEFKSIELRDEAIRFFARGAMILVVKNGEIVFPEDGRALKETLPDLARDLKVDAREGDLIAVTWSSERHQALKSVLHVALFLKRDELPKELISITE